MAVGKKKKNKSNSATHKIAKDGGAPNGLIISLLVMVPFCITLALRAIFLDLAGTDSVFVMTVLCLQGLLFCFYWRRLQGSGAKTTLAYMYVSLVWLVGAAFAGIDLVAPLLSTALDLPKTIGVFGLSGSVILGIGFAFIWAIQSTGRLRMQAFSMTLLSLCLMILLGFGALRNHQLMPLSSGDRDVTFSANGLMAVVDRWRSADGDGLIRSEDVTDGSIADVTEGKVQMEPAEGQVVSALDDHHAKPGIQSVEEVVDGIKDHMNQSEPPALADLDKSQKKPSQGKQNAKLSDKKEDVWDYGATKGPANWGKVYQACARSGSQSPVDIPRDARLSNDLKFLYHPSRFLVQGQGAFLKLVVDPADEAVNVLSAPDSNYLLREIHFHTRSEHTLSGVAYPMEVQLVHRDSKGRRLIVSSFVEYGPASPAHGFLKEALQSQPSNAVKVAPSSLLPALKSAKPNDTKAMAVQDQTGISGVYRYSGSLTNPPCDEPVDWAIFRQPIAMSKEEIRRLEASFGANYRPSQDLGKRQFERDEQLSH